MARSVKHTPISGITTAVTEKENKRLANRKFRHKTKIQTVMQEEVLSVVREISNVWAFDKDGKRFLKAVQKKDMRK